MTTATSSMQVISSSSDRNKDNKVNFGKYTVNDPGDMRKIA